MPADTPPVPVTSSLCLACGRVSHRPNSRPGSPELPEECTYGDCPTREDGDVPDPRHYTHFLGGSGPAQLALALSCAALEGQQDPEAGEKAVHVHQQVKALLVGDLPHDRWALPRILVEEMVQAVSNHREIPAGCRYTGTTTALWAGNRCLHQILTLTDPEEYAGVRLYQRTVLRPCSPRP